MGQTEGGLPLYAHLRGRGSVLTWLGEFFILFSSDWPVGAGVVGWGWGLLALAQAALSTCLGLCFLGIQPREGAQCQRALRLLLLVIPPTHQSTHTCLFLTHTLTFTLVSKAQGVGHASRAAGWGVDCHGLGILRKTDEARPTLPGLQSSGGRHCCPKSWVSGNLLLVMKGTHGFCAPSMCHSGDPMSGFEDLDGKVRSI